MNSNIIQKRQNDEALLKVQYAARVSFNSAEKFNRFAWIACIVSAFSVFLPSSWPMYIINGIPWVADIFAFIFSFVTSREVNRAATLRKYFDAYVLNIQLNQFSETELRRIRERTQTICSKKPIKAAVQMSNTGKDPSPGVRNWYTFSKFYDGLDAQFECQRQNAWWNPKMFTVRMLVTVVMSFVVGSVFVNLLFNHNTLNILLCSAGILIKIYERLIENWRYIRSSDRIDGAVQTMEVHPTKEGIEKLQNLIDERRSINVVELRWVHDKLANNLSKLYEKLGS